MSNVRPPLDNVEQLLSEMWVLAGKLEGKGWEYFLEVAAVLEVPRTEEACAKLSILGGRLSE